LIGWRIMKNLIADAQQCVVKRGAVTRPEICDRRAQDRTFVCQRREDVD